MSALKLLGLLIVTSLSLVLTTPVMAQNLPLDPIRIRVTPETPGPNAPVRITLEDATAALQDATITWTVDGKVVQQGTAQRTLTITTGTVGEITRVNVRIETSAGTLLTRDFVFQPSAVRLIWEANTYTPPFFKGKALASPGSDIRVIAFTDIRDGNRRLPNAELIFQWEKGGTKFADKSGMGVSSFTFQSNQLSTAEEVAVTVLRSDGTRLGRGVITIPLVDPLVLLYEKHPLRGIRYEQALTNGTRVLDEEVTIVAEPYYFSTATRAGSLQYTWLLDGIPAEGEAGAITLRHEQEGERSAQLSLSIQHLSRTKLLQAAESSLALIFGEAGRSLFNFSL